MTAIQRDPLTHEFQKLLVFEFYGCFFHECPIHLHPPEQVHPMRRDKGHAMKWGEIFELDAHRLKVLQVEFGDVNVIYECEFERDYISKDGKHHDKWAEYLKAHPDRQLLDKRKRTESEILQMVNHGVP